MGPGPHPSVAAGHALHNIRKTSGLTEPLPMEHIVWGGVRDLDPLEADRFEEYDVQQFSVDDIRSLSGGLKRQMDALSGRVDAIYVHIDMDVLDPAEVPGHDLAVDDGPSSQDLAEAMTLMFGYPKSVAIGIASTAAYTAAGSVIPANVRGAGFGVLSAGALTLTSLRYAELPTQVGLGVHDVRRPVVDPDVDRACQIASPHACMTMAARLYTGRGASTPPIQEMSAVADQGMSALVSDLHNRGMLDTTRVIWMGEFGRTPMFQGKGQKPGRDHHIRGFSMWMCGGGIKGGVTHGATDELGFHVAENPVHIHDLQATILNQMGLDHEKQTFQRLHIRARCDHVNRNGNARVIAVAEVR